MAGSTLNVQEQLNELKEILDELEPLEKRYQELRNKLKKIKENRRNLINELNRKIDEIVQIVETQKKLRKEFLIIKEEYKIMKEEKRKYINRLRELREIIRNKPRLPKPPDKLREELERLELIYETVHQDPRRERRLVEQITEISSHLKAYEMYISAKEEIGVVRKKIEEINLDEYREKMDKIKEELDRLRSEENILKSEAEKLQKAKTEVDIEINTILNELSELETRMKGLKERENEILNRFGIKRATHLSFEQIKRIILNRSALLERALKKMERGESLTFEEFAILVKNGLI